MTDTVLGKIEVSMGDYLHKKQVERFYEYVHNIPEGDNIYSEAKVIHIDSLKEKRKMDLINQIIKTTPSF